MKICHISDTHGTFPNLHGNFDIIVHSGDLFPNSYNLPNKQKEAEYQK